MFADGRPTVGSDDLVFHHVRRGRHFATAGPLARPS
jgi:hypothetical protein